jgi:hypothetical protein
VVVLSAGAGTAAEDALAEEEVDQGLHDWDAGGDGNGAAFDAVVARVI